MELLATRLAEPWARLGHGEEMVCSGGSRSTMRKPTWQLFEDALLNVFCHVNFNYTISSEIKGHPEVVVFLAPGVGNGGALPSNDLLAILIIQLFD